MRSLICILLPTLVACASPANNEPVATTPTGITAAANEQPATAPALLDRRWELVELQGAPVAMADGTSAPHFTLAAADSTVAGNGGCNGFFGGFHTHGTNGLRFGDLVSTLMACPDMGVEGTLYEALRTVDGYALHDGLLELKQGEMVVARWRASE